MFTFSTAGSIRFGAGTGSDLISLASGKRVFVVTGATPERYPLIADLDPVGEFRCPGEPTFEEARAAVAACRKAGADLVVGIGGGGPIDLAKAVAVLVPQDGDPLEYAEVVGAGRALSPVKIEMIAVPTTAGTGSEVTANAVLASPEHQVKVSLRGRTLLPDVAIVDPALTITCPPGVTAHSGMDALTQCIEPFVSWAASPLTDGFAREGMRRARSLPIAYASPTDLDARTDMALCSLLGGLSLANAKLGAVHGFAAVIGGMTRAPHGAICAALLAPVTAANLAALQAREPENSAIRRYREVAEILVGTPEPTALIDWLSELSATLNLAGLSELGLEPSRYGQAVTGAQRASSMKGNPVVLSAAELHHILLAAA